MSDFELVLVGAVIAFLVYFGWQQRNSIHDLPHSRIFCGIERRHHRCLPRSSLCNHDCNRAGTGRVRALIKAVDEGEVIVTTALRFV